jgi:hypothetical protein
MLQPFIDAESVQYFSGNLEAAVMTEGQPCAVSSSAIDMDASNPGFRVGRQQSVCLLAVDHVRPG